MFFLQVPNTDEITKEMTDSFGNLRSGWTQFWTDFIDSPFDALKFLGQHALSLLLKIVIALIIFYVGRWLIRKIKKIMKRIFEKRKIDSSVQIFLNNFITIILTLLLGLVIISFLGIPMTGFVAIFAAAAFAFGMALSGTLSNFAGGVLILLLKPLRIGDYIEAQGYGGTVKAIQLFSTVMTTPDNKTIIIPNGPLSTGNINNFSRQKTRRVEWKVGLSYGDDFDKAKKVIQNILDKNQRIISKLETTIAITELSTSSVNIVVRGWVRSSDFWDAYFEINREIYIQLPVNGIHFPFNQVDVHITQMTSKTKEIDNSEGNKRLPKT